MRTLEEQKECKDRLIHFACDYLQTSQRDWALKAGLSPAFIKTFSGVLRRTTRVKIEQTYPQLNINWLLTGEGDMLNKIEGLTVNNTQTKIIVGDNSGNFVGGDQKINSDKSSLKAEVSALRAELRAKQAQIEAQQAMIDRLIEKLGK